MWSNVVNSGPKVVNSGPKVVNSGHFTEFSIRYEIFARPFDWNIGKSEISVMAGTLKQRRLETALKHVRPRIDPPDLRIDPPDLRILPPVTLRNLKN